MADSIDEAGVASMRIRAPLTCEAEEGVCTMCYGRDLARGTRVNQGEAVGIIAAQSIGEPGTQLTMRTFHIGGTAQVAETSFVEATNAGTIKIVGPTVKAAHGDLVAMSRNVVITVVVDGKDRESHKVPYGARLRVKEGVEIKRGERMAEWDPSTTPIITEVGGAVRFEDLADGLSVKEETDEATGITQRVVSDWRASPRGSDLRPALGVIKGESYAKLASGSDARYLLPVGAILSVNNGDEVKPGEIVARIPTEGAKTRDITGGLPRVAELFEARRPKDCAVIAEMDGRVEFGRDYKNKRRINITPEPDADGNQGEPVEFLIPKGKHISVHDGDLIQKGDYIIDGNPDPHDLLRIQGVEALAEYLVNEVQEVYRLQGVPINDKHIEVIVRQMLQKVEILDAGETGLIKGDHMDRPEFDIEQAKTLKRKGRPATTQPVLLGITKASLQTKSFISAASFQETTRVLTDASVNGTVDTLEGLKENVIVGRLIPAGTGAYLRARQKIANERDAVLTKQREDAVEPLPADLALELEGEKTEG
jgi:DNA-directed RNA polymerase subunit beta'